MSLITYGGSVKKALEAARRLALEGIEAEVVDLRTLRPLDEATILASVARTHRAVIVDEGWRSGSLSGEIAARIQEHAFFALDAPVARVCSAEVPLPYPRHLELAATPQPEVHRGGVQAGAAPMSEFKMPSLGADMEAGTLVEWMKQPGDPVERGEVIAAVETQKGAIEIEVFETGILEKILVDVGQQVPVGTVLALIRGEGESEPVASPPALLPTAASTPPMPPHR